MRYLYVYGKARKFPELGVDLRLSEHKLELFPRLELDNFYVNFRPVLLDCHLDILVHEISGNVNCLK